MDIGDTLTRVWDQLLGRASGPLHFRLILQPLMAIFFAVRDGLRDGREGRGPFLWVMFYDPPHRLERLKNAWESVGKVFLFAIVLDLIYEFVALRRFYPIESLIVAFFLALVPYVFIRGPVRRIARHLYHKDYRNKDNRTNRAA